VTDRTNQTTESTGNSRDRRQEQVSMKPYVSVITLGVKDVNQAKQFYGQGLGWPIVQDYGTWVCFGLGDGKSAFGLYPLETLAQEAGVPADGSRGGGANAFGGVTFSYIVRSAQLVDAVLAEAERAGGTIVKPAQKAEWGGYFGYFADPDGYLWKVAYADGDQPFAAE
jgi:catechol 2,3-dioxygenase-like lactoylglutathione lyase family enzyme